MSNNWAELNQELLHLISKKLENFSYFIRFRSVCKQWRLITDPTDPPPQLPWILQPTTLARRSTDYRVYSLSSDTTSRINLPENHLTYTCCLNNEPTKGFILFDTWETSYMFNPLTKTKFNLPDSFLREQRYFTIYMDMNPNNNSSTVKGGVHLVVCVIRGKESEIGFFKSHNSELTTFRIPLISSVMGYYKRKLFVYLPKTKNTRIFDMTTGTQMSIVIPDPVKDHYFEFLVEAMGDLLGVASTFGSNTKFKVFRLEHTNDFRKCKWVELKGIGDKMLFLGGRQITAFCLSARQKYDKILEIRGGRGAEEQEIRR